MSVSKIDRVLSTSEKLIEIRKRHQAYDEQYAVAIGQLAKRIEELEDNAVIDEANLISFAERNTDLELQLAEAEAKLERVERIELKNRLADPDNYYQGIRQYFAADIREALQGEDDE